MSGRKTRSTAGGNQVLKYDYRILVSSFKNQPVQLQVWDRLPKGETESVGVILGKTFIAGGNSLRGAQNLGATEFRNMLSTMETAIAKAGKAKPGDKTILDAVHGANLALAGLDVRAEREERNRLVVAALVPDEIHDRVVRVRIREDAR